MSQRPAKPRFGWMVPLLAALCVAASGVGCGTRVRSDAAAPATTPVAGAYAESSSSAPAVAAAATAGQVAPSGATAGPAATIAPAVKGSPAAAAPKPTMTGAASAPAPAAGSPTAGAAPTARPDGASPSGGPGTPGLPAQPPAGGAKSPIVLASVGTISGPIGAVLLQMLRGAQVWVKWANQRGGLNGHRIDFVTYDDGGDPSRHAAQVREAVERRGAIAFLMNVETVTGEASVDYVTQKRLPLVGLPGGEGWGLKSPMYFPHKANNSGLYRIHPEVFSRYLVPKGVTKWGTLVCAELQGCSDVAKIYADRASALGYEMVYQAKASVAQPDYTAECLAARNAGVQAIQVIFDSSGIQRFSSACARQGYKPTILIPATALYDRYKSDPTLDGALSVADVYPWFVSGTPAIDEFHQAVKTFGQAVDGGGIVQGWVAGKLMEKAGAAIGEPPTSAQILAGLWQIKNDTLGGLTGPLTYIENQPVPQWACGALLIIKDQKWLSPDPTIKCY